MSFELKYICKNNGIPLYEDPYMNDDMIHVGKIDSPLTAFFMCSPKTANIMRKELLKNERLKKLIKINEIQNRISL